MRLYQLILVTTAMSVAFNGRAARTTYFEATIIGAVTSTIDYCSNFVFEDGKLVKYLFDGGYCSFDGNLNPTCHYYEKDHLGSVRMVVNENGTIEQVNHYSLLKFRK